MGITADTVKPAFPLDLLPSDTVFPALGQDDNRGYGFTGLGFRKITADTVKPAFLGYDNRGNGFTGRVPGGFPRLFPVKKAGNRMKRGVSDLLAEGEQQLLILEQPDDIEPIVVGEEEDGQTPNLPQSPKRQQLSSLKSFDDTSPNLLEEADAGSVPLTSQTCKGC